MAALKINAIGIKKARPVRQAAIPPAMQGNAHLRLQIAGLMRCGEGLRRGIPQPIGREIFLTAADAPGAVDTVPALPPQPWRLGQVGGQ